MITTTELKSDIPGEPEAAMIPHNTVAVIVAQHDKAVESYGEYFDALALAQEKRLEAERHVATGCGDLFKLPYVDDRVAPEVREFRHACADLPDLETLKRVAGRLTAIQFWHSLISRTELEVLMDATAREELRGQMAYVPEEVDRHSGKLINGQEIAKGIPPVTEESIHATLEGFRDRSGDIWRRGIATAFSKLDSRFKSHDGFKVGNRIVLTNAVGAYGWEYHNHHQDTLRDVQRIFRLLDGKAPQADYACIVDQIATERKGHGYHQSVHEGDYFRARCFQNGNIHLWFTRKDIVQRVNELLAEYYGLALGFGKDAPEDPEDVFNGAVDRPMAKNFGLFPSPPAVVERVIDRAELWSEEPMRILEPSAGTGNLSSRALKNAYDKGPRHRVDVVEIQADLAAELKASRLYSRVHHRDFLAMTPERVYDVIVMNPPFDLGRDVDHVNHALKFLAPGGRLVAVMSASAAYGSSAKAEALREKVTKGPDYGPNQRPFCGRFSDLPERSFAPATNVNTVTLKVTAR